MCRQEQTIAGTASAFVALTRRTRHPRQDSAGSDNDRFDNFDNFDTLQLAETLSSTIDGLTNTLGAVAAVTPLVGGMGMMNIMLVNLTQRPREIGLHAVCDLEARSAAFCLRRQQCQAQDEPRRAPGGCGYYIAEIVRAQVDARGAHQQHHEAGRRVQTHSPAELRRS